MSDPTETKVDKMINWIPTGLTMNSNNYFITIKDERTYTIKTQIVD